jgi:hypothetical protein
VVDVPPPRLTETPPEVVTTEPPVEALPPKPTALPPVLEEGSSSPPELLKPQPTAELTPANNTARTTGACFNMTITFQVLCGGFATSPDKRARLIVL